MKITFFSSQKYDRIYFNKENEKFGFELEYFDASLDTYLANVITDSLAVCVFVNDKITSEVIEILASKGVKIIALRCAGFNNVDIDAASRHGIKVCRVPAYSPEAVAEHAIAMILTLNRKTHKAYNRVREQNFSLDGLLGFDIHKKSVGIIGMGRIGQAFCKIMLGFGCKIYASDVVTNNSLVEMGVEYTSLNHLYANSDIISLHCPLNQETKYLIDSKAISQMKNGVMLINTSRGALIKTEDVILALKKQKVGYLGIDVYEQEENLFFRDLSSSIILDDTIQRLMSFPNVLITAHQAFFTNEALTQIAECTLKNVKDLTNNKLAENGGLVV